MRLHLFGASGSGVTTLGTALAAHLNLPYFDSDDYFWEKTDPPFTVRCPPNERNARISADLTAANDWILGGSVINWGQAVFPVFDLIVFLWIPPDIRLERLKNRELERYGSVIQTDPERRRQFKDFLAWAADYDQDTGLANRTLKAHEAWLRTRPEPVLELRGDLSTAERLERVLANVK
ncbi:adenylate kinase [Larkinella sp. VNQ87]|uniref:adenylate kinase n=1 Tax=Larkinella sp. VNQ87 TaxID=3400921 RepID=UPI003C00599D